MNKDVAGLVIGWALWAAGVVGTMVFATGCSFGVEVGWHGQTGRDDRTQTQLIRGAGPGVRPVKEDDRY